MIASRMRTRHRPLVGMMLAAVPCAALAGAGAHASPHGPRGSEVPFDWPLVQTLAQDPQPVYGSQFGSALAASGDLIVVGAPHALVDGIDAGAAYVGLWNREATLYNLASNERMGTAVADAGARIIAGVPQCGSGAAQIHLRDAIFADGFEDTAPE